MTYVEIELCCKRQNCANAGLPCLVGLLRTVRWWNSKSSKSTSKFMPEGYPSKKQAIPQCQRQQPPTGRGGQGYHGAGPSSLNPAKMIGVTPPVVFPRQVIAGKTERQGHECDDEQAAGRRQTQQQDLNGDPAPKAMRQSPRYGAQARSPIKAVKFPRQRRGKAGAAAISG